MELNIDSLQNLTTNLFYLTTKLQNLKQFTHDIDLFTYKISCNKSIEYQ